MPKYICTAKCPELDSNGTKHCNGEDIDKFLDEIYIDGCPCGNTPIWSEINDAKKIKADIKISLGILKALINKVEWVEQKSALMIAIQVLEEKLQYEQEKFMGFK